MELALSIVSVGLLCVLAWQDFSSRSIDARLLGILFLVLACTRVAQDSISSAGISLLFCTFFIALQLTLLWCYFFLKNKKPVSIIDTQIGLGDIFFLLVVSTAFTAVAFVYFFTSSLLLTIGIYGLYILFTGKREYPIPLAGSVSLFFLVVLMLEKLLLLPHSLSENVFV